MSEYKHKENQGSLFVNSYKEEGSNQPDYKGTANVNGQEVQISGWKNQTNDGKTYLSLKYQEPYEGKKNVKSVKPKAIETVADDDLPF